jgi:DUF4097 and DUF4098 domain-containing protein YvlB
MSTVPPSTPPGGAPPGYPPYDPKTQWRVYREQQKAAWRAQRDAWKAQKQAYKAGYVGGNYVPRVPSIVGPVLLVGVGIVGLLIASGRINFTDFRDWYGHWWPLLLIAAGLALLGEWALDMRRPTPVHRGGGFVGMLVLLAIIGIGFAGWNNFWGPFRAQFGDQGDDFFNSWGLPEHDFDQQLLNTAIPANGTIDIQNPRGDISIASGDGANVEVQAHEVAYASSDSEAKKIFDSEAAHIVVSGNAVLVKSESNNSGRINLTITVPKSAHVSVNDGRGDITAAGLGAGVTVSASQGDIHLSSITGSVQVHFASSHHDFSAHQIDGDVTADGDCNDFTLSEVKGKVTQNGDILGDVHIENVGGPIHLHTSVTDLQVGQLSGDLTLNSDDLRVSEAKGQVRVTTHSKDVDLSQIYGDTYVEDRDGRISLEPGGNFAIDAKNNKGDIELTLPPTASASINAHTRNGDIVSDFAMPSTEGEDKSAAIQLGSGAAKITLATSNGDVHIKKGGDFVPEPPNPPTVGAAPRAPIAPTAPHLKAPKAPPEPVSQ